MYNDFYALIIVHWSRGYLNILSTTPFPPSTLSHKSKLIKSVFNSFFQSFSLSSIYVSKLSKYKKVNSICYQLGHREMNQ